MTLVSLAPRTTAPVRKTSHPVRGFVRQTPLVNINEFDDSFSILLAVPGISKQDITLDINNDQLIIQAVEENETAKENMPSYVRKEYDYHTFRKVFKLNDEIDQNKIEAILTDGILEVKLDKKEEAKIMPPRSIKIK